MKKQYQNIEIPKDGLELTKIVCQEVLQPSSFEIKKETIKQLYQFNMMLYMKTALLGLVILLGIAWIFPSLQKISVLSFFTLLGIMAAYELHKHTIYDMEELLSTVYLNPGRSFLYKCLLTSTIQFLCFIVVLTLYNFLFQIDFGILILSSLLPVYTIQGLSILFENKLHKRTHVLIFYTISYAIYYLFYSSVLYYYNVYHTQITILSILLCIIVTFLFIALLWNKARTEREEMVLWN